MKVRQTLARLRRELAIALAIAAKDVRVYYLAPPMIMFGLLLPFFMFFSFSVRRGLAPAESVARLLAITTFFTASSAGPVILPMERSMRTFERMLVAPVALISVLAGEAAVGMLFGAGVSILTLLLATIFLGVRLVSPVALIAAVLLASAAFSALGLLFASWPTSSATPVGSIMMPATLVRWPLMFVSGVFVPLEQMSQPLRAISYLSPLTYAQDLFDHLVMGRGLQPAALNWAALVAFLATFIAATIWFHRVQRRRGY